MTIWIFFGLWLGRRRLTTRVAVRSRCGLGFWSVGFKKIAECFPALVGTAIVQAAETKTPGLGAEDHRVRGFMLRIEWAIFQLPLLAVGVGERPPVDLDSVTAKKILKAEIGWRS